MDKRVKKNVDMLREVAKSHGLEIRRRKAAGHQQWEIYNPHTGAKRLCTVAVSPSDPNYLKSARRAAIKKARVIQ